MRLVIESMTIQILLIQLLHHLTQSDPQFAQPDNQFALLLRVRFLASDEFDITTNRAFHILLFDRQLNKHHSNH